MKSRRPAWSRANGSDPARSGPAGDSLKCGPQWPSLATSKTLVGSMCISETVCWNGRIRKSKIELAVHSPTTVTVVPSSAIPPSPQPLPCRFGSASKNSSSRSLEHRGCSTLRMLGRVSSSPKAVSHSAQKCSASLTIALVASVAPSSVAEPRA
jgi:hypothetical protein